MSPTANRSVNASPASGTRTLALPEVHESCETNRRPAIPSIPEPSTRMDVPSSCAAPAARQGDGASCSMKVCTPVLLDRREGIGPSARHSE
jgi:hypothetical protein